MSLRLSSRTRSRSQVRASETDGRNRLAKSRSGSRAASPSRLSRRTSKLQMYLQKSSRRNSSVSLQQGGDNLPHGMHTKEPKRWDGLMRKAEFWDSLRRDGELWLPDGDCLIHFHEKGSSRRGASLRVSLVDIESSDCRPLLNEYPVDMVDPARDPSADPDRYSRYSGYYGDSAPLYEMFIPAPTHMSKEEAMQFHLTTRNFFAWMYNRPLIGEHLGQAIIRLQKRMNQYRPDREDNQANVMAYIDDQGYMDFRSCPDHALALLQYAEHFRLPKLWTDAFVHCAGMHDDLDSSSEFSHVSRASQALITRAHIEMDIRLDRAGKSLEDFLESDIPCGNYTFSKQAHMHLERFRSFLQCYYIGRYGYWPPNLDGSSADALPKTVYQSMYFDLRNLYEYLADKSSEPACMTEVHNDQVLNVSGNLQAFDMKNRYTPLPFCLVLLPDLPETVQRRRSRWNIFGFNRIRQERRLAAFTALKEATNHDDHRVMGSNIVREYLRFERDWTMVEDPTHTCVEARKVRWILIYAMLQTLISVAKVPEEVRQTEGVNYPLCCQTAGTPPWSDTKTETGDIEETPVSTLKIEAADDVIPDFTFLKPSPLRVPSTINPTQSQYQADRPAKVPLRAPRPIRASSIDFLRATADAQLLMPQADSKRRPFSLYTPSKTTLKTFTPPMTLEMPSPLSSSDPSTPSSSDMENSGWSASSSDGGMDHNSVEGSDSNEGYFEDNTRPIKGHLRVTRPGTQPLKKIPSNSSMMRYNPELEAFLAG